MPYYPERYVEAALCEAVRRAGGKAYKFVAPGRTAVPDRLLLHPQHPPVFVECKARGAQPTKAQAKEHAVLRALGSPVYVVDTPKAAAALVQELYGPPQVTQSAGLSIV